MSAIGYGTLQQVESHLSDYFQAKTPWHAQLRHGFWVQISQKVTQLAIKKIRNRRRHVANKYMHQIKKASADTKRLTFHDGISLANRLNKYSC
jgi:hypothetical protein